MTRAGKWNFTWPRVERRELVHSVRTTIAAVVSLLMGRRCKLPESYWAAITTMIAIHRFIEISLGIVVGLLLTAVWPESQPPEAESALHEGKIAELRMHPLCGLGRGKRGAPAHSIQQLEGRGKCGD